MTRFVGLDVSQKLTAICVVDGTGRRLWRGQCPTHPEQIEASVRRHAGDGAVIGVETGPMTPCTEPGSMDTREHYAARLRFVSTCAARASSGLRKPFFSISHSAL